MWRRGMGWLAIATWLYWIACLCASLPSRFYDVKSTAELLGVKPPTVRTWIDQGLLAHVRAGPRLIRISPQAIDEFLRRSAEAAR
jgi:excisionase family DNA binding protein